MFYFLSLDTPLSENLERSTHAAETIESAPEATSDQINVRENVDIPMVAQPLTRDRDVAKGKNHPHKKR